MKTQKISIPALLRSLFLPSSSLFHEILFFVCPRSLLLFFFQWVLYPLMVDYRWNFRYTVVNCVLINRILFLCGLVPVMFFPQRSDIR